MRFPIIISAFGAIYLNSMAAAQSAGGQNGEGTTHYLAVGYDFRAKQYTVGLRDPAGKLIQGIPSWGDLAWIPFNYDFINNGDPTSNFLDLKINGLGLIKNNKLIPIQDMLSLFTSGKKSFSLGGGFQSNLVALFKPETWKRNDFHPQLLLAGEYTTSQDEAGETDQKGRVSLEFKLSTATQSSEDAGKDFTTYTNVQAFSRQDVTNYIRGEDEAKKRFQKTREAGGESLASEPSLVALFKRWVDQNPRPLTLFEKKDKVENEVRALQISKAVQRFNDATQSLDPDEGDTLRYILSGQPKVKSASSAGADLVAATFAKMLAAYMQVEMGGQVRASAIRTDEKVVKALVSTASLEAAAANSERFQSAKVDPRRFLDAQLNLAPRDPKLNFTFQGYGWQDLTGGGVKGYVRLNALYTFGLKGGGSGIQPGLSLSYLSGDVPSGVTEKGRFQLQFAFPVRW